MKKNSYLFLVFCFLFFAIVFSCEKKKGEEKETILKGKVTVLVDETLMPVIEDQVAVFQSQYNTTITLIGKSESEIVQLLSKDKGKLAILSRKLTASEAEVFEKQKITPRITPFATDAVAFIANKNNQDTIIDIKKVLLFMQGNVNSGIKGLVFDNPNSSTVRHIKELAKVKDLPKDKIFSFKNNNEVIKFVSENKGMIGVVGVNWLTQPMPDMVKIVDEIKVLSVNKLDNNKYVQPTQDNIATGVYPLTREIYMLNYQGFSGLGMGFASFMAGEIGQRIILKSGLVPTHIPSRNIVIRNEINNSK
jgi:phosphate transport system substrate-binding protein